MISFQIVIHIIPLLDYCAYHTGFTESLGRPSSGLRQRFCLWYHTEHMSDTCHLFPCVSADGGSAFHTLSLFAVLFQSHLKELHYLNSRGERGENDESESCHTSQQSWVCAGRVTSLHAASGWQVLPSSISSSSLPSAAPDGKPGKANVAFLQ